KNKGVELGLDTMLNDTFGAFVNYAFQSEPIPTFPNLTHDQAIREINLPSKHQFNAGLTWNASRVFGQVAVSHTSEAFWQDVLDSRYAGFTKPYTAVNA